MGHAGPPRCGRITSCRRCRRQRRPARVVDGHLAAGRAGRGRTERSAGMIRVRHLPLPTGLNAFVRKGADGDMEVFVSDGLDPGRARAAVRLALRSFGPAGRTAGLLPIPVALLLAGGRSWLRALLHAVRTHLIASAATAASVAVATSAVVVVALPQQHHPATASRGPAPSHVQAQAPRPGTTTAGPQPVSGGSAGPAPSARSSGQAPAGNHSTAPAPHPTTAAASTAPAPQPSGSSAPAPSPSPTSTSSGGGSGGGTCVVLLGLTVCL